MTTFKMILENKCEDGKTSSRKTRVKSLNEIQTLFDEIGREASVDECMIRSAKVRWLTCKEDMEHWKLSDEK